MLNFFRQLEHPLLSTYEICIQSGIKLDQRVYNSPSVDQVVVLWIEGNTSNLSHEHDIIVHYKHTIKHYYGRYDPIQSGIQKLDISTIYQILETTETKEATDSRLCNLRNIENIAEILMIYRGKCRASLTRVRLEIKAIEKIGRKSRIYRR